jgi:hypothetical protein
MRLSTAGFWTGYALRRHGSVAWASAGEAVRADSRIAVRLRIAAGGLAVYLTWGRVASL